MDTRSGKTDLDSADADRPDGLFGSFKPNEAPNTGFSPSLTKRDKRRLREARKEAEVAIENNPESLKEEKVKLDDRLDQASQSKVKQKVGTNRPTKAGQNGRHKKDRFPASNEAPLDFDENALSTCISSLEGRRIKMLAKWGAAWDGRLELGNAH